MCLKMFPPKCNGCEIKIVVIDNSWEWSPCIRGLMETRLGEGIEILNNPRTNKFHASALDSVVAGYDFDYLCTMESDVCVLRDGWLQWLFDSLNQYERWFAAGHWHWEGVVNPSFTLYRGSVLKEMLEWSSSNKSLTMRWGDNFEKTERCTNCPLDSLLGPFAEKRGWPEGTVLRERPRYQSADPGHYDPGHALYYWARQNGDWGYARLPTVTAMRPGHNGWPFQTIYGLGHHQDREIDLAELIGGIDYACHFWLGTRSLEILKCNIDETGPLNPQYRNYGLPREARFWQQIVDRDTREKTIALIKKHRWHTASLRNGSNDPLYHPGSISEDDWKAVEIVEAIYRENGIPL